MPNGDKEKYKGQILFRAVEYIQQLQRDTGRLPDLEAREKQLTEHLEKATANMPGFQAARIEELERENQTLREESGENLRKWAEEKVTLDEELISLRVSMILLEDTESSAELTSIITSGSRANARINASRARSSN